MHIQRHVTSGDQGQAALTTNKTWYLKDPLQRKAMKQETTHGKESR